MPYTKHSNPSDNEIRDELTSVFPDELDGDKNADFRQACVAMASFLANTARVEHALKQLEARLRPSIDKDFELALAHYKQRTLKPTGEALDDKLRHLLSRELTRVEIQLGFNTFSCTGGERAQTYVKFINPDRFRAQLQLGRHWKDPTVPGGHGEHTHRLQWYLLAHALQDSLQKPVEQFMRIGSIIDTNPENSPNGLWDALFDRVEAGPGLFLVQPQATDCRCPESMTNYIVDDAQAEKWPLLHWYIKSRLAKRRGQGLNNYGAALQYVTGKMKKLGMEGDAKAIVGTYRTFETTAPGMIQPGEAIMRTPRL